uniref:Protein FAM3C-like n=2 Tax=Mastacembelus armatus TaxID=205130 RepID=A0A3Q3MCH3_9TELE
MIRRLNIRQKGLLYVLLLVPVAVFITVVLQNHGYTFTEWRRVLSEGLATSHQTSRTQSKQSAGLCDVHEGCAEDDFSFSIRSGAANVVPPKICIQNKMVLGSVLNNAGSGINIVTLNGKTGEVMKTGHFDMYHNEVNLLIEFLQKIEKGSVVLMASYDEVSTNLNKDARELIAELGSSAVQALGFRDNWLFVGRKGTTMKSNFEKHLKNDKENNKYENWPELIDLKGCIPKNLE